ncbi:Ni/Fe hydrogenase subunit alpha [Marinobacterium arenosum]|uniref:Ni/Fe hydrogenase subunit alpha n=1 Tax=Marinobacterium arenosum TaxID=2862496 RepID=UPI001C9596EB|nr:Ni/Fe hydrogenase subunit alpha [Marinobacterium arenosum]MBY4676132.1 Ni/Fe hydrogenase subunit alpha [Marinobacterium arenosum]
MARKVDLNVPILARVEGEGALELKIRKKRIKKLQLRIYEPPRFFEKFLEGRHYDELPDLVARICGICPVAYQTSAVNALESLFGVEVGPWVAAMRRVLYCGEWIESHALHIHLLALPDFFGYDSGVAMARDYPEQIGRGLRLQALGNDLMRLLGARSVHPVGIRVGGFHRAPDPGEVGRILERLHAALPEAAQMVQWLASIERPRYPQSFTSVALRSPQGYAIDNGALVSSGSLALKPAQYPDHFEEFQAPHSTALWSQLHGEPYLVGPLARLNLNAGQLATDCDCALNGTLSNFPSQDMFDSMLARGIEICWALSEAARLLESYQLPDRPAVEVQPRAGVGCGWSEAPRGLLWHRYELDGEGLVRSARIVPPTSQNQARIEQDLHHALEAYGLDRPVAELRQLCEQVIRNYDPCISCATHFLNLKLDRP